MKLFGKRKKSSEVSTADSTPTKPESTPEDEQVSSYFSPGSKIPDHDIEKLLAMDPSTLTAKQRRVAKRHQKRSGETEEPKQDTSTTPTPIAAPKEDKDDKNEDNNGDADMKDEDLPVEKQEMNELDETNIESVTKNDADTDTDTKQEEGKETVEEVAEQLKGLNSKERRKVLRKLSSQYDENFLKQAVEASKEKAVEASKEISEQNENKQDENTPAPKVDETEAKSKEEGKKSVEEVAEQLKGLNSKERRKLLRNLASEYDEEFLEKATEVSKKIAEENEAIQAKEENVAKQAKEQQVKEEQSKKRKSDAGSATPGKKKAKNGKNLSHLPQAERERREHQKEMQKEAAARRAAGEVLTRHPLNSERRRANRRKPGRAGKIAILRKQSKQKQEELNQFNAGGYTMRHEKKNY